MKIPFVKKILLPLALLGSNASLAFQVNPDGGKAVADAIEKKLKTPVPMDTGSTSLPAVSERLDPGPQEYWFNPIIHTFGNTNVGGGLHAAVAPLFTKLIDLAAYDGKPVRERIAQDLRRLIGKPNARVADLCCGVGISTRALQAAFQDAHSVVGIDTSPEMIEFASMIRSHESLLLKFTRAIDRIFDHAAKSVTKLKRFPTYKVGNAERTGLEQESLDLVTIMYGFHEIPFLGRYRILREVRRLLKQGATLAVVDISPSYTPSETMLAGEPYVLEYKKHIMSQLRSIRGFADVRYNEIVPGHVGVWLLTRSAAKNQKIHGGSEASHFE